MNEGLTGSEGKDAARAVESKKVRVAIGNVPASSPNATLLVDSDVLGKLRERISVSFCEPDESFQLASESWSGDVVM